MPTKNKVSMYTSHGWGPAGSGDGQVSSDSDGAQQQELLTPVQNARHSDRDGESLAKLQRLISVRDLWMKAHGYARIRPVLPSREPPNADPHARWCGEGGLITRLYQIGRAHV